MSKNVKRGDMGNRRGGSSSATGRAQHTNTSNISQLEKAKSELSEVDKKQMQDSLDQYLRANYSQEEMKSMFSNMSTPAEVNTATNTNTTASSFPPLTGLESLPLLPAMMSSYRHETIREVWNYNLHEEMNQLKSLIKMYPYIAMDTEFPGVTTKAYLPVDTKNAKRYDSSTLNAYTNLAMNVNMLRVIQVGISLFDHDGNVPSDCSLIWQFNMHFDMNVDLFSLDSKKLLTTAGIEFERHTEDGINHVEFGRLLLQCGLLMNPNINWVVYHGSYDFAYLLKLALNVSLPYDFYEFLVLLRAYFPFIYDLKFLASFADVHRGSLQDLASGLKVMRIGVQHQAGSDAQLTGNSFFKCMSRLYNQVDIRQKTGYLTPFNISMHYDVNETGYASFKPPNIDDIGSLK